MALGTAAPPGAERTRQLASVTRSARAFRAASGREIRNTVIAEGLLIPPASLELTHLRARFTSLSPSSERLAWLIHLSD